MTNGLIVLVPRFKFIAGPCLLLSGDGGAYHWIIQRIDHLISGTANDGFTLGDGLVFPNVNVAVEIRLGDEPKTSVIDRISTDRFQWKLGTHAAQDVKGIIGGLVESGFPAHNYFEISSEYIAGVAMSTGEYSSAILKEMVMS